jgi:hypothetical protein
MQHLETIRCAQCNEMRQPSRQRSLFCAACNGTLVAQASRPVATQGAIPAAFRRNDYRGDL